MVNTILLITQVASTTWIQLLVHYSGRLSESIPFSEIDIGRENIAKYGLTYLNDVNSLKERTRRVKEYFSFVFVRNPFER